MIYLLLGEESDPCTLRVAAALRQRGQAVLCLTNPLLAPQRFAWRLGGYSQSAVSHIDQLIDTDIAGVLVRTFGRVDPTAWAVSDRSYVQAEVQGALLGWLWSLDCPVINRYPAHLWYQPQPPLIAWWPLLRRCELLTLAALVTNVPRVARAFGETGGALYTPLTTNAGSAITTPADWAALEAMQQYAPVYLTPPHQLGYRAMVVGGQVIWDMKPAQADDFEPKLVAFTASAGLSLVALDFAATNEGPIVSAVEPYPSFEHFTEAAQQEVAGALAELLMGGFPRLRMNS